MQGKYGRRKGAILALALGVILSVFVLRFTGFFLFFPLYVALLSAIIFYKFSHGLRRSLGIGIIGLVIGFLIFFSIFAYVFTARERSVKNYDENHPFDPTIEITMAGNPRLGEIAAIRVVVIRNDTDDYGSTKELRLGFNSPFGVDIPGSAWERWNDGISREVNFTVKMLSPGIWTGAVVIRRANPNADWPDGFTVDKQSGFYLIIGENASVLMRNPPIKLYEETFDPRRYFKHIDFSVKINSFNLDSESNSLMLNVTYVFSWSNETKLPYIELGIEPNFELAITNKDTNFKENESQAPKMTPKEVLGYLSPRVIYSETQNKILTPGRTISYDYAYEFLNIRYAHFEQIENNKTVLKLREIETEPLESYNVIFKATLNINSQLIIPGYFNGPVKTEHILRLPGINLTAFQEPN